MGGEERGETSLGCNIRENKTEWWMRLHVGTAKSREKRAMNL